METLRALYEKYTVGLVKVKLSMTVLAGPSGELEGADLLDALCGGFVDVAGQYIRLTRSPKIEHRLRPNENPGARLALLARVPPSNAWKSVKYATSRGQTMNSVESDSHALLLLNEK